MLQGFLAPPPERQQRKWLRVEEKGLMRQSRCLVDGAERLRILEYRT